MGKKLSEDERIQILEWRKKGWPYSRLAHYFGVSTPTVTKIIKEHQDAHGGHIVPPPRTPRDQARARSAAALAQPPSAPVISPDGGAEGTVTVTAIAAPSPEQTSADTVLQFAIARDLTVNFLTADQIARKHRVAPAVVGTIARDLRNGKTFPQPPGFVVTDEDLQVTPDRRVDTLKETSLVKMQAIVDSLPTDPAELAKITLKDRSAALANLARVRETVTEAAVGTDPTLDLIRRAGNATVILGNVNIVAHESDLAARLRAAQPPIPTLEQEQGGDIVTAHGAAEETETGTEQ